MSLWFLCPKSFSFLHFQADSHCKRKRIVLERDHGDNLDVDVYVLMKKNELELLQIENTRLQAQLKSVQQKCKILGQQVRLYIRCG